MDKELATRCQALLNWETTDEKLRRSFQFKDFNESLGFIVRVGVLAEKANHHPHIANIYNNVTLELSTHDAGDVVTEKDAALAEKIDKLLGG